MSTRAAAAAILSLALISTARADEANTPPAAHSHEDPAGGAMSAALGAYPFTRESSGTSWQPDTSEHAGIHVMSGDWMVVGRTLLNGVYDRQQGPRGDEKTFLSGMLMAAATRQFADGDALRLRAMLSPDPLMGKSGLPLLLASGETADGTTPLVDRQHPHDLFMELSGSYSRELSQKDSAFIYAGLPGEPAFGPPAFMHRLSISDSPEPPITHHWLDSTHITFGVVTLGWVHEDWKFEGSRFRGREPDQFRYNIETGALDSNSLRLAWNPAPTLSLQVSSAHVMSPEQLYPAENQSKESASAIYTRELGAGGWWSTTAAWGRRSSGRGALDAYALESTVKLSASWSRFGRAEREQAEELDLVGTQPGPVYAVGKVSAGIVRSFRIAEHLSVGLGGLYSFNSIPGALALLYGDDPRGAMVFVRLKVD